MNKQTLLNELNNYLPNNEEEKQDLKVIIDFLKNNDNAYLRDNNLGHITASSWIINQDKTKVLMIYHNIYHSWSWTGGHADGDEDLKKVAVKEALEETNLSSIKLLSDEIFSLEILTVDGHYKKGKYVNSHLHLNITYLLQACDQDVIKPKLDENKAVKWIDVDDIVNQVEEPWMMKHVYQKLIDKVKKM